MAGVVANGVFYNTDSGLSPALDRLTGILADNAKFSQRQSGYEDAGILPRSGAQSGGILSMLGIGPRDPAPPNMPIASASTHQQGQDTTPAFGGTSLPSASPAASAGPALSGSSSPLAGFQNLIDRANTTYGLPTGYLPRVAAIESKFDPSAVSPTGAKGLFGFTQGTAAQYGLHDPSDVPSSVDAFGRLTRDNAASLRQSLGRDPTQGELYLAHQQGAAGAAALLKNPSMPAGQVLASINADPNNITVNGGNVNMPAGAFASKWTSRFGGGGGGGAPVPGAVGAQPTAGASQGGSFPNAPPGISGITTTQIQALLRNPATEQIGLKLWESAATGKNFDFHMGPDGTIVRENKQTGQADMVFRAPVKQEFHDLGGRATSFDPQAGTVRDVTPPGLEPSYRWATPDERKAAGVQDGMPLYIGPGGKPGFGQGGTNVTLNNAIDPLQKAAGDRFDRSLTAADAAAKTIPAIRVARQQLQAGIISGAGANQGLALQKIGAQLGVTDPSRIQNTETFRAAVGPIVLQTVKGLGAGAGISNADRDFAERMAGGDITADAGSIARMLDIHERAAQATIAQHNALVDQIQRSPAGAAAYRNIGPAMRVEMPSAPASASGNKTIGGATYVRGPDGHWYSQ